MTFTPTIHDWPAWEDTEWPVNARYSFAYKQVNGTNIPIPNTGHLIMRGHAPTVLWRNINTMAIHYTAADDLIDGDSDERYDQLPNYLRSIQLSYAMSRAYSIGYNWAVDWLGGVWKLRGWDLRCAANKDHNEHTIAILCLVDGADPTSLLADQSIRWLTQQAEWLANRQLHIIGHGELQNPNHPTACPGKGILNKIHSGVYSPRYLMTPTTPPSTEDDMTKLYLITDKDNEGIDRQVDICLLAITGTFAEWIGTEADRDALALTGIATHQGSPGVVLPVTPFTMDRGFLKQFVLVGDPPRYPMGYTGSTTTPSQFRKWVD